MPSIGTIVLSQESPQSVINTNSTSSAFMVGLADWGPGGASGVPPAGGTQRPATSLGQAAALIGTPNAGLIQNARSSTNATLYDSADAFFRESGASLYLSRVLGPNPTKGTLAIKDGAAATAATLTAAYYGAGSSGINVAVSTASVTYTVTLTDAFGNVLAVSPSLVNTAAKTELINWAATTNLITAASGVSASVPTTASAAVLSTGSDDRSNASVAHWTNALNLGFSSSLGPGQVMAPGQPDTSLRGIWSALASHAQANNRVALLDGTDGNTATQAIAEVTTAGLSTGVKSYCGIWAGNLQIPGITSGTVRVISPSPVVAALCARADNMGNPNLAAAGTSFPLNYVSGQNTAYTDPISGDISTLNTNGINVFSVQGGTLQNYGFVSAFGTQQGDPIYFQLAHSRLRMAIIDQSQAVAQPYLFAEIDGRGLLLSSFSGALQGMLINFYKVGALFGATTTDAFTVNANESVNTPTSMAAGNLIAYLAVRMAPFAQLVTITVNAVPITQGLPSVAV